MIDSSLKNANILLVDDKESNIDVLEGLLEDSGFTNVRSSTDPRLVVDLFRSFQPDLILLDLMMPYLSGFEVMDLLKTEISPGSYLPILVLTADISTEVKLKALSVGAKDFLSKPFDLYEVRLRMHNLLETRYLYQQLENQNSILEEKVMERTYDLIQTNNILDKANKELAVLDQAKNEFLNLVSHELRTPLNGILGFAEILKAQINSPELLTYIQYLDESAKRLEKFSYRALLITELHAGKHRLEMNTIIINHLLNELEEQIKKNVETKQITLCIHKDPTVQTITGDLELIRICFEQIARNSVKYAPVNGKVEIKVYSDQQSIVCEFTDNGPGFPDKILNNPITVFMFGGRHIDNSTGLNLTLSKLIMDAHQGRMEIFNNANHGATVRLIFSNQESNFGAKVHSIRQSQVKQNFYTLPRRR
jgi:two-component system, sensor histidine kinase and response regulator